MDPERTRILSMFANGTISAEECDSLLQSQTSPSETQAAVPRFDFRSPWTWLLLIVSILVYPLAMIFAIIDCARRDPMTFPPLFAEKPLHEKWIWLALILFGHILGAPAYLTIVWWPRNRRAVLFRRQTKNADAAKKVSA
jgi:uncharacterized integral membrane protein